jgi:hypothetical protein
MLLRDGETFRRWGLVGGFVIKGVQKKKKKKKKGLNFTAKQCATEHIHNWGY